MLTHLGFAAEPLSSIYVYQTSFVGPRPTSDPSVFSLTLLMEFELTICLR